MKDRTHFLSKPLAQAYNFGWLALAACPTFRHANEMMRIALRWSSSFATRREEAMRTAG